MSYFIYLSHRRYNLDAHEVPRIKFSKKRRRRFERIATRARTLRPCLSSDSKASQTPAQPQPTQAESHVARQASNAKEKRNLITVYELFVFVSLFGDSYRGCFVQSMRAKRRRSMYVVESLAFLSSLLVVNSKTLPRVTLMIDADA